MSVAVGVAASDGLVLSTDSRAILRRDGESSHYRVSSDSAEKLFITEGRFAVATYGMALIGGVTIRGLLEEFAPAREHSVRTFAGALGEYFNEHLSAVTPPWRGDMRFDDMRWPLGFVVAGYDDSGVGQIFDVEVRAANSRARSAGPTTQNPGVVHRGQSDAIQRLLDGVDLKSLGRTGIQLPADDLEKLELLRYDLILPTTVDDAVELAEFLVDAQIRMQRFSDGTYALPARIPGCGGPIRTAAVARTGATWVSNPGKPLVSAAAATAISEPADGARERVRRSA